MLKDLVRQVDEAGYGNGLGFDLDELLGHYLRVWEIDEAALEDVVLLP
jgi:hypothetical protein